MVGLVGLGGLLSKPFFFPLGRMKREELECVGEKKSMRSKKVEGEGKEMGGFSSFMFEYKKRAKVVYIDPWGVSEPELLPSLPPLSTPFPPASNEWGEWS